MEVHFQTDWYAQAEHGGYYQAVAQGYFADLSMNVVIDQGGPGAYAVQKVATGKTAFAPWFLATTSCSPSDRVCRWSSSAP
jgi:NitT/TauT family transport system substrate-binding protein